MIFYLTCRLQPILLQAIVEMAEKSFSEEKLISSMFCGVWKSRCLSVVMSLGVPELLCNSSSPVSIQEIAERTGCRTEEKIYKVMRTMAQWGIGEELSEKCFKANRAMELLRRDKGSSLGHMVSYYGSDEIWTAMLALPEAIKHGGDTAFEIAHGMSFYDYMYKVEDLEYSANETKPRNVASHEYVIRIGLEGWTAKRVYRVPLGQVQPNHGYRGRRRSIFVPHS